MNSTINVIITLINGYQLLMTVANVYYYSFLLNRRTRLVVYIFITFSTSSAVYHTLLSTGRGCYEHRIFNEYMQMLVSVIGSSTIISTTSASALIVNNALLLAITYVSFHDYTRILHILVSIVILSNHVLFYTMHIINGTGKGCASLFITYYVLALARDIHMVVGSDVLHVLMIIIMYCQYRSVMSIFDIKDIKIYTSLIPTNYNECNSNR